MRGSPRRAYVMYIMVSTALRAFESGMVASLMMRLKESLSLSYTLEGVVAASPDFGIVPSGLIAIFLFRHFRAYNVLVVGQFCIGISGLCAVFINTVRRRNCISREATPLTPRTRLSLAIILSKGQQPDHRSSARWPLLGLLRRSLSLLDQHERRLECDTLARTLQCSPSFGHFGGLCCRGHCGFDTVCELAAPLRL